MSCQCCRLAPHWLAGAWIEGAAGAYSTMNSLKQAHTRERSFQRHFILLYIMAITIFACVPPRDEESILSMPPAAAVVLVTPNHQSWLAPNACKRSVSCSTFCTSHPCYANSNNADNVDASGYLALAKHL